MASTAEVTSARLGVASSVANIATIPFNTLNAYNAGKTQASNFAASAKALTLERENFTRIFDRETKQLAADQTLGYIMSGLEFGHGGTPESVMASTAEERSIDRAATVKNYDTQIANAKAAEAAAKKSARNSLIGGAVQGGVTALALFSDERLKEHLVAVGRSKSGLTIYLGRYTKQSGLDDGKQHLFLLAQEVQNKFPDAVKVAGNGYLMVDYTKALIGA